MFIKVSHIIGIISAGLGLTTVILSILFLQSLLLHKCDIEKLKLWEVDESEGESEFDHQHISFWNPPNLTTNYQEPDPGSPEFSLNQTLTEDANENDMSHVPLQLQIHAPLGNNLNGTEENDTNILLGLGEPTSIHIIEADCYIPKYLVGSGFSIVAGLLQIGFSLLFALQKRKDIKHMSIVFYSHFFIFLAYLTTFCIIIHLRIGHHLAIQESYRTTSLALELIYSWMLGSNILWLVSSTAFLCLSCNVNDYDDQCEGRDGTRLKSSSTMPLNYTNNSTTNKY